MSSVHTKAFKQQVIQEARDTGNASLVARRHQLNPGMVRRWVREAVHATHPSPEVIPVIDENERLKRLLGEKDLQIALLQDLLRKKGILP